MGIAYNTSVVRDGLVLHLDAANIKSYPGSGTTWYDLSGNGNNGTLVNGVEHNPNTLGYFSYDGVNDQVPTLLSSEEVGVIFTVLSIFSISGNSGLNSTANRLFTANRAPGSTKWCLGINLNNQLQFAGSGGPDGEPSIQLELNKFYFTALRHNQYSYDLYLNDVLEVENESSSIDQTSSYDFLHVGSRQGNDRFWNGDIAMSMSYNRILSDAEIRQNFEALRGRYGI
jgi:hypothetical protein